MRRPGRCEAGRPLGVGPPVGGGIRPNSPPQARCWARNKCSLSVLGGGKEGSLEPAFLPGLEDEDLRMGEGAAGPNIHCWHLVLPAPIALLFPTSPPPTPSPSELLSCMSLSILYCLSPFFFLSLSLSLFHSVSACLPLPDAHCLCLSCMRGFSCYHFSLPLFSCLSLVSVFMYLSLVISLLVALSPPLSASLSYFLSLSLLSPSVCLSLSRGGPFRGRFHQGLAGHGAVLPVAFTAPATSRARRPPVPRPWAAPAWPWSGP